MAMRLCLFLAGVLLVPGSLAAPIVNGTRREGRERLVVGGGGINSIWRPDSAVLEMYRGFGENGVKVITAAGSNPIGDGTQLVNLMAQAGISAEWVPIHDVNCDVNAFDPAIVAMIDSADAIFYGGGQSGRLQSCLYGDYSQSGIEVEPGQTTPVLEALWRKEIVGGSSAGAMNQPMSEILVTGHSVESYSAVSQGAVFQRNAGNRMLETEELVDSHFSERGRQGRLMIIAMNTGVMHAYGVDEDAAYVWRPSGEIEVICEAVRDGIKGGVVVYVNTVGTPQAQSANMHFLTEGDRFNPNTGEITYNPDKTPCEEGALPEPITNIFTGVNYRTASLQVSQGPTGGSVPNFHGSPAVEVRFTKIGTTVAMCGVSGQSFGNLLVEQFQTAQDGRRGVKPTELPQDYMWEWDEL